MADGAATQSMDEILAQIRKIIAEEPGGLTRAAMPSRAPAAVTSRSAPAVQRAIDLPAVASSHDGLPQPTVSNGAQALAEAAVAATPADDLSDLLESDNATPASVLTPKIAAPGASIATALQPSVPAVTDIEPPLAVEPDDLNGLIETAAISSAPDVTARATAAPAASPDVVKPLAAVEVADVRDASPLPAPATHDAQAFVPSEVIAAPTPPAIAPAVLATSPDATGAAIAVGSGPALLHVPKADVAPMSVPTPPLQSQPVASVSSPQITSAVPAASAAAVPLSMLFSNRIDPAASGGASRLLLPTHIGRVVERPAPVDGPSAQHAPASTDLPPASSALGALAAGLAATALEPTPLEPTPPAVATAVTTPVVVAEPTAATAAAAVLATETVVEAAAPALVRPSVDAVMKALEPILREWLKIEMQQAVNDALHDALPRLIAKAEAAAVAAVPPKDVPAVNDAVAKSA